MKKFKIKITETDKTKLIILIVVLILACILAFKIARAQDQNFLEINNLLSLYLLS